MQFHSREAIYLQIVDYIGEKILKKEWLDGDRIPAVREMAVDLEVNPNTVVRAYAYLGQRDIIYQRRGIGCFVSKNAYYKALELIKTDFLKQDAPAFIKKMHLLGINFNDINGIKPERTGVKRGLSPKLSSDKSIGWKAAEEDRTEKITDEFINLSVDQSMSWD